MKTNIVLTTVIIILGAYCISDLMYPLIHPEPITPVKPPNTFNEIRLNDPLDTILMKVADSFIVVRYTPIPNKSYSLYVSEDRVSFGTDLTNTFVLDNKTFLYRSLGFNKVYYFLVAETLPPLIKKEEE
jgi:hypothetical protein